MVFDDKELNDSQSFDMPNNDMMGDMSADSPHEGEAPIDEPPMGDQAADNNEMDTTYMAIMSVIIIVMIYILYSMYSALVPVEQKEIKAVEPAPAQVEQPVQQPPQQQAKVAAPPVEETSQEEASSAQGISSDISARLQKQDDAIASITDDTSYLENGQKDLSTKIDKLSSKLDALLDQVEDMIEEQKDRELKAKRRAEQAKLLAEKKLAPPMKYYIRAVVEGRAWLQTDDGGEATVSVGQTLKDYGTVLAIYVNQGMVTTSSGRVISFKENES